MSYSISEFIYKGANSQVLLFTMKREQHLKTHYAPVDVMIIVAKGLMKIEVEEKTTILNSGDHILLTAKTRHAITALDELQFYLIKLSPHER